MPVLKIIALQQKPEIHIPSALKKTASSISEVYGCDPSHVWVTWQELPSGYYVEGEETAYIQQESTHPPIGELICFEGQSPEAIETLLKVAASTLSSELNLKNNIFITYREIPSGQVIAGDGIVKR